MNIRLFPALHRMEQGGWLKSSWGASDRAAMEIALAIMLFAGAGLLLRSFLELTGVNPQFRQDNLIIVDLVLPESTYSDGEAQALFVDRLVESVNAVPVVRPAGITTSLPLIPTFLTGQTFVAAASVIPAVRAMRIDPMAMLRQD